MRKYTDFGKGMEHSLLDAAQEVYYSAAISVFILVIVHFIFNRVACNDAEPVQLWTALTPGHRLREYRYTGSSSDSGSE